MIAEENSESPTEPSERFDVAVIGSGPGGSVVSTLLAQMGYSVVMIEREKFPRFHVGESLLPGTQSIWERLEIDEELQNSGHTFKYAGEFRIGRYPNRDQIYSAIGHFHNIPRKDVAARSYAYQVERAVFDKQLQDNAVRHGVTLWDETSVKKVLFDDDRRATGLELRRMGRQQVLNADFIVDASGRRRLIAEQLGCVKYDKVIKTSAAFGHFKGVQRDPGKRQGYFNGYFIPNGWVWFIPLANDVMSVGVVQNQPATDSWSNNGEEVLLDTINRYQFLQDRFRDAVQVGRVRMLKDLAYETTEFCGDGWMSIGDANFFVDPLYSSGVQIAHSTGEKAAEVIDAFLKGGRDLRAIEKYRRYIKGYRWRVFGPMRCFYRCMRHYIAIAGYVLSTGHWFNHFDNWFLRRACSWGTGRFHKHNWVIQLMSLNGNICAWVVPKIGLGGWSRYEKNPNPNPRLQIPKAPELEHGHAPDSDSGTLTSRALETVGQTQPC